MRSPDTPFVVKAVEAVGRVAALGGMEIRGETVRENCLRGLNNLIVASKDEEVVGAALRVVRRVLQGGEGMNGGGMGPEEVRAAKRFVMLCLGWLGGEDPGGIVMPEEAGEDCLWVVGEWSCRGTFGVHVSDSERVLTEVVRLLGKKFSALGSGAKLQGLHLACKVLTSDRPRSEAAAYIVDMAALDIDPDVRDRGRWELNLLRLCSIMPRADGAPAVDVMTKEEVVMIMRSAKEKPLTCIMESKDVNCFR